MDRVPQLLLGLVAIGIAIALSAAFVSDAVRDVKRSRDTITVTGSAKHPIEANLAMWSFSVSAEGQTPQAASAALRAQTTEVRRFLEPLPDDALSSPPIGSERFQKRLSKTRSITMYRLHQSYRVETEDIEAVEELASSIDQLFQVGVAVQAGDVRYVSTQLADARFAALRKATADARKRAETLIGGIGGELGPIRRADLGVFQITPRNSTEVSDYGINDTSSREKDVTAVVTVTFAVD